MYTKYTILVTGDNFNPDDVINKLDTELVIDKIHEPNKSVKKDEFYGRGSLILTHKNKFSTEYPDEAYEKVFIDFYEKNHSLLKQAGANDFNIILDVYYSDQCNFEIFNKHQLRKLGQYEVSLPISIYYLDD